MFSAVAEENQAKESVLLPSADSVSLPRAEEEAENEVIICLWLP